MATDTYTNNIVPYNAKNMPTLGNTDRFIANELLNIQKSIASIISVMKLLEGRMNTDGLA